VRRRILAVLALVTALAAASAPLARADGGTVTIAPSNGGAPRTLSLAALAGSFDVHGATYTLRAPDGTTSTTTVADGISLGALLSAAGLDGAWTYAAIAWPDGGGTTYVFPSSDAVVWSDAQGVRFLRASTGAGDANAADDLTFPGGTLSVRLHRSELYVPQVSVSPPQGRPHQPLVFSAALPDGRPLPAGMRFQWYFDGGDYVYGARVTHRFPAATTYKVQLNVVRGMTNVTNLPTIVHVRISSAPVKRAAPPDGGAQGAVVPAGGTGAGGAGFAGGAVPGHAASTPAAPVPRTIAAAPRRLSPRRLPPPQGRLVSGTLVASTSAALPLASGGRAAGAAPGGALARGPLHVPVGAWVAIGLAALLGLGWALESRHTLPFWQP